MKNYYSSMKLGSGVKIFLTGKAGSNDAMISSSLLNYVIYIYIFNFSLWCRHAPAASASASRMTTHADVAYLSSLAPLFMAEAALGWSTRWDGPETSPGDRMKTGWAPPPCRDWSSKDKGADLSHKCTVENCEHCTLAPSSGHCAPVLDLIVQTTFFVWF